jgi:4-hydroxyphenylpyruvate dioxygenase
MKIPAIRGVGGSLLYFLEPDTSNWDQDFVPIVDDVVPNHLNTIDHISQSLPNEQMLSWQQFYTGIFNRSLRLRTPSGSCKAKQF